MNNLVIGISGVARSGKDTFASLLKDELLSIGVESKIFALANQLKKDLRETLLSQYKIDPFTSDSEEKKIIRPALVEYGRKKRIETQGTYWTSLVQKEINLLHKSVVCIVSDIRYSEYSKDEVSWVKDQEGLLIHITRYEKSIDKKILPPNPDEAFNDPILEAVSDYKVVWPTTNSSDGSIQRLFVKLFLKQLWLTNSELLTR